MTRGTTLDTALHQEVRRKLRRMVAAFRSVEPGVNVQLQVISEERLFRVLHRRNLSGLGPDLLLVTHQTAEQLAERRLIRPTTLRSGLRHQIKAAFLQRARLPKGRFSGLPLVVLPQLACFDRRRIPSSPRTVEELEQAIASGLRVSLPVEAKELAWTIGALGAMESFVQLRRGGAMPPDARQRIRRWRAWLEEIGLMQRFSFSLDSSRRILDRLGEDLDWTTCRSDELVELRQKLGKHFGVAPLPSGPGGAATPVSELWVLARGVNSSQRQRLASEQLGAFTVNAQMQRVMTLTGLSGLPVNREVNVPVESSFVLRSLVEAGRQGRQADPQLTQLTPSYPLSLALGRSLREFVFGLKDLHAATDMVVQILRSGGRR